MRESIRTATRAELIEYLEARGIACYDDERTSTLREAALEDLRGEGKTWPRRWEMTFG